MRFLGLLDEFKKLEIDKAVNFEVMNEILISHHSTAIEGSSLTEDETRMLLAEGITAKGKPITDHNMVTDHHKALLYVLGLSKKNVKLEPEEIQKISSLVMNSTGSVVSGVGGDYDISKGEFRKGAVFVGNRYFTSYLKVANEVNKLCDWINKQIDNVKNVKDIYNLAFDTHFYFVSIHPFGDGNGRVSRLLMNYILAYNNEPLAIIFKEDKHGYFEALEEARKGDKINLEPIRKFMYSEMEKYLEQELSLYKKPDLELGL